MSESPEAGNQPITTAAHPMELLSVGLLDSPNIGNPNEALLFLTAASAGSIKVTPDTHGGIDQTVCFMKGTRLLGLHGDIAVEDMEPGDRLITNSGAMRPVKWVGRRLIDATRHPRPDTVWPIRIEAGAIDHGLPERALYVSPDHALYLNGCLIPAKSLLNGHSVVQEARDRIMYFHVELESHDILLAESLPVESYLEIGNRNFYENGGGAMVLHPSRAPLEPTIRDAKACAPFAVDGDAVAAVRARLLARLPQLRQAPDCRLRAMTDQGPLAVTLLDQMTYRIDLLRPLSNLVLLSHAMVPAESDAGSRDRRRLGLDIAALEIEGSDGLRAIGLNDPMLRTGWHCEEKTHRWTNGEAQIPAALLEGGHALIVRLHAPASGNDDGSTERDAARVAALVVARRMSALRHLQLLD
ncbi:MAG: Hint domain-containing protein [Acidiphilium sp.]|nr:Hint domain-containing protein [Acidiphilium sp.]MDD4936633.1 Hint domain-containing protein [Acidiphilium sp.]